METVHKQEYRVRDLATRSVTLFPTRAQVVREIKDVPLKPGPNQITIVGLTPTVDEHSIKVEGTGSAIITDIAVELLPNRDIFQDIYPDSDDDKSDKDDSDDEDDEADDKDTEELENVHEKLALLRDDQKRAKEVVASAESRLKILDAYGKTLDRKRGVEIETGVDTYRREREKVFEDHMKGAVTERALSKEIAELVKEEKRLLKLKVKEQAKVQKAKAKVRKAKEKEKEKERRREAEQQREKNRIRAERERFWPRSCYTVRITLDAGTAFTPASSRRTSIASATDLIKATTPKNDEAASAQADGATNSNTCDLLLTYVTSSAFWSPSYDLALSTTSNTAVMCFDANLTNTTSEAWSNCKVILSTSQTTFAGLSDTIPVLVPWRIKLAGKYGGAQLKEMIDSREERNHKSGWAAQQNQWAAPKNRAELFGTEQLKMARASAAKAKAALPAPMAPAVANSFALGGGGANLNRGLFGAAPPQRQQLQQQQQQQAPAASFGQLAPGGTAFGSSTNDVTTNAFGSAAGAATYNIETDSLDSLGGEGMRGGFDIDGATILPEPVPELAFQDSAFEETGLTTTYDLPGLKSLSPSSSASKQRVARISFANVVFSHTVVAKYKPVAYLKAKLRNSSKLTLLKGPAGLTLDGSFMGRATLPRCSAGGFFSMSLGVDPAITVAYPKPDVKRSTTGLFSKEDSSAYTRAITIANTRSVGASGKPVNLVVVDQVPVSEDEKLRIEVAHPRGLALGGNPVATGAPGREGKDEKDWGRATAQLKQLGEITWDVNLNAGRCVKLSLEYEVALPVGEHVMQV